MIFLRGLYTLLLALVLPFIFIKLWLRGRKLSAYRDRWAERLAKPNFQPMKDSLWIHAVSVGEAIAAVPIVHRFLASHPDTPIVITTMTPTGSARVRDIFKDQLNQTVFNAYVPYDLPWLMKKFIRHIQPNLFIAMETEIWPNLYQQLGKAKVPLVIANGRLSPHSFKWYKRFSGTMAQVLKPVSHVAAQSMMDAERFAGIGMSTQKVTNTGNIKFDFEISQSLIEEGKRVKALLAGPVLIAASTHEGEEKILLKIYLKLLKDHPALKLILVPRHPDRFEHVAKLCELTHCVVDRRSLKMPSPETQIYLGDSMGEMMIFYAASDVAFVGGSLVGVGGHNLLEPAALSLPIVTGKHLFNFMKIAQLLETAKAVDIAQNEQELWQSLNQLINSRELRESMGQKAKAVVASNRGALDKLFHVMTTHWKKVA